MQGILRVSVLGLLVLGARGFALAQCTSTSDAQLVQRAATQAASCNYRKLRSGPSAHCPSTAPPPCAGSLVSDAVALAYGPNNPPAAAVDTRLATLQLRCQRQIGTATAHFIGVKLRHLIKGFSAEEAEARARTRLDKLPTVCAVTVLESNGVVVPAVGKQAAAAVGPPAGAVDATALRDALVTLLEVWVDRVAPDPKALRPNFVLIVSDDQRADTADQTWMPTLTAELAASGVVFPDGFASNPVCCPSRSTILTGQYAHTHGVLTNNPGSGATPYGSIRAFSDLSTLATWLQSAGYHTAMLGKYLNGYKEFSDEYAAAHGGLHYVAPGWDRWFAVRGGKFWGVKYVDESGAVIDTDPGSCLDEEPGEACPPPQPADCPYHTDQLRDRALAFIDEAQQLGKPFFLYFATKAPHGPACPADRHRGLFAGIDPHRPPNYNEGAPGYDPDDDKPAWLQQQGAIDAAEIDDFRIRQLESLQAVDDAIEAIMAKLREIGQDRDTVVAYYGDNGYLWGEHRRTKKACPYEECLRVPFLVRYPRLAPLSRTEPAIVGNVDLAPTFAELAGVNPIPLAPIDGRSIVRVLDGTEPDWRPDILGEHWGKGSPPSDPTPNIPTFALVREAQWKYTEYCTGELELYDLADDPFELSNVAGQNPDVVARLAARLRAINPEWPALPFDCGEFQDTDDD